MALDGNIEITKSNAYYYLDSMSNDMIIYTGANNQHILIGTTSNNTSTINVWHSNVTFNRLINSSCNITIGSNPTYGVSNYVTLQSMHDFALLTNNSNWPTNHGGKALYMRYSQNGTQDAAYIQSIYRDGTSNPLDIHVEASNIFFATGNTAATTDVRVTFKPDGKVGIATSNPTEIVHIVGNTRINTGKLTLDSTYPLVLGSNAAIGNASRIGFNMFNNSNFLDIVGGASATQTGREIYFWIDSNQAAGSAGRATFHGGTVWLTTGSIGIGRSNPVSRFHITSNALCYSSYTNDANSNTGIICGIEDNAGGGLFWNTSNHYLKFGTNNVERLKISSNGYIGIGVSNPVNMMHLHNPSATIDNIIQMTNGVTNSNISNGFQLNLDITRNLSHWLIENAYMRFATNNIERMRIDSLGNIGIGTSTINAKLHVNGTVLSDTASYNIPTSGTVGGTGDRYVLRQGATGVFPYSVGVDTATMWFSEPSSASYKWYQNGTQRMIMDSSGNVALGTLAPIAGGIMSIAGKTYIGAATTGSNFTDAVLHLSKAGECPLSLEYNGTQAAHIRLTSSLLKFGISNTGGFSFTTGMTMADGTGGTEIMRMSNNGNVGVLCVPNYPLDINGTITSRKGVMVNPANLTSVYSGIPSSASWVFCQANTGSNAWIGGDIFGVAGFSIGVDSADAGKLKITTGSGGGSFNTTLTRMTIDTSGKVGIGNTAPGYQLTVNGDIYASGAVRISTNNPLVFDNYSGGWNMTESTWIRAYNDKYIYTGGAIETNYRLGVGLGVATTPSYRLHVNDAGNADWLAKLANGTVTAWISHSTGNGLQINTGVGANAATYALQCTNGTTTLFTVSNNGSVTMSGTMTVGALTTSGNVGAGTFSGNGASITNLNAANIATGTLPVARGGTGTTTSTGTGSVVLSASPTFSGTITGGTFSGTFSGNGASITSINAGNISAGTLPVARGGTGTTSSTGSGSVVLNNAPSFSGTLYATYIQTSAFLGVQTAAAYPLQVNGAIYASGDITAFSDMRKKKNITKIDNALNKVSLLNGYTFELTEPDESSEKLRLTRKHTGVIAQEVKDVLPEVIYKDANDYMGVAYGNMVGLLVEAIKELKNKYENVSAELSTLLSKQ